MEKILNDIANFLNTKIDFLNVGSYSPALYIALAGVAVVFLAFLIALIAKSASRTKKARKCVEDAAAYVNSMGFVDEENVEYLNEKINTLPPSVGRGWGNFLSQQNGYPSDYITEKDALEDRTVVSKRKAGKDFFNIVSAVIILLCIGAAAVSCKEMLTANVTNITLVVLSIAGALFAPLLFFIIFSAILNAGHRGQIKKFTAAFIAFQDALDSNVLLYREEQDEFISENIEEINATIEEILANKLAKREIIDIVTTPAVEEEWIIAEEEPVSAAPAEPEEIPEPVIAVKPQPAPAQPAPVAKIPTVADEVAAAEESARQSDLLTLVILTDNLIQDKKTTPKDILELLLVFDNSSGAFVRADESSVFSSCLELLSEAVRAAEQKEKTKSA